MKYIINSIKWSFATIVFIGMGMIQAQNLAERVDEQSSYFEEAYPVEKTYLQLDKSLYVPGETVWIKAYVVKGVNHMLSDLSGVLYAELIDAEDNLLEKRRFYIANGEAVGDFTLANTLAGGKYRIRAYTNWMRNFDRSFETTIQVLAPVNENPDNATEAQKPDVQYLPEGGNWIAGLETKIAFKAVGLDGLGVDIAGQILDETGNVITNFASAHKGMGRITLTPDLEKSYTAKITYNGETYAYSLPDVKPSGWNVSLTTTRSDYEVNVRAKGVTDDQYVLVGSVRDRVIYSKNHTLTDRADIIRIPKDLFSSGIVRFTVLDMEGVPQSERVAFNRQDDNLRVFVNTDNQTYAQRDEVAVEIVAADAKGNPIVAPFSIAVTHSEGIWESQPDRSNIMSYLWLSSDLKGFVEDAPSYFEDDGPGEEALDLVMLTHGWRAFEWNELLEGDPGFEYYIEPGLSISGQAFEPNGEPLAEGNITLVIDNILNTFITEADQQGRFQFNGLAFLDTTQLFLQGRTRKNKKREVTFKLDPPDSRDIDRYPLRLDGYWDNKNVTAQTEAYVKSTQAYLAQQDIFDGIAQYELGEVQIVAQAPEEDDTELNTLYGRADFSITGDELPQNLTVLDALRGRVPGVNIVGNSFNPYVSIRGSIRGQPLFLIDGIPTDVTLIQSIPMADVDRIDVLKGPSAAIYGARGGNGVIAVYTKRGYDEEGGVPDEDAPGVMRPELPGYDIPRIFYAPQYKPDRSKFQAPDLRNTLYWNPVVRTDKDGKATLKFYNGDLRGEFVITVEGISVDGKPGVAKEVYEVK